MTALPSARLYAYGTAALCVAALVGHFLISLPDALSRGREGVRRTREAPCLVLQPSTTNQALGQMPQPAPDFSLPNHEGKPLSLASLKGRVVLVNFWATWCKTCDLEMDSLEQLAQRMKGRPFTLLAVSVDTDWAPVRSRFPQGTAMTMVLDKDKQIPPRYGTEKFPESFLVDADGTIRYYVVSERRNWHSDEVVACLDALMNP